MIAIDPALLGSLRDGLGDEAAIVLDRARANLIAFADANEVEIDGWLPGATCSLILTGRHTDWGEVVARAALLPWEVAASTLALEAFSDFGGIAAFAAERERGLTIQPRLRPAEALSRLPEEKATAEIISLVCRLREAPSPNPRPDCTVAAYMASLETRDPVQAISPRECKQVRQLLELLIASSPSPRLMHGDLHHLNVVSHTQPDGRTEWVAIDPEGIWGDPAYEWAAFLRNPIPEIGKWIDLSEILAKRIIRFADATGDAPERIWAWAYVRTALTIWRNADTEHPWWQVYRALRALEARFAFLDSP